MTSTDAWVRAAKKRAEEASAKDAIQTGTSTGNKAAEEEIFSSIVDTGDNQTFKDAVDAYFGTFDTAFEATPNRAAEDFRQAWIDGVNKALGGEDPQAAMDQANQVAQQALDGAP